MIRVRITLAAILFFLHSGCTDYQGVGGQVVDQEKRIVAATVMAYREGKIVSSVKTDSEGYYFLDLHPGTYTIVVRSAEYDATSSSGVIVGKKVTMCDFVVQQRLTK